MMNRTKTEAAFLRIRLDIEDGVHGPGEWLRVNKLAERLNMSPTPIREALRLLQSDGLVEHVAHHGVRVRDFSKETLEEIFRLRAVLEPLATELAAERATKEQIEEMRRRHEELREAVEDEAVHPDLAKLNEAFHWAIYSACGSPSLMDFIRRLWAGLPVSASWVTREASRSVNHHEEVVEMIERRDARGAAGIMRSHIQSGGPPAWRRERSGPQRGRMSDDFTGT